MPWRTDDCSARRERLGAAFADARRRGRVPARRRITWWAGIAAAAVLAGAPEALAVGILLFEALVAPRLARRRRRPLGTLAPWRPPDSWKPSPEAPAPTPGRPWGGGRHGQVPP